MMPQFSKEGVEKNKELIRFLIHMAEEKNATPAQISLAWMLTKKPWIVPIPGTRQYGRLIENGRAADIRLTQAEVEHIDRMLTQIPMSEVFGGSRIAKRANE